MNAAIRHVLFDFGDTLAREPFCVVAPPGVADWEAVVLDTYAADGLCDRWCVCDVAFADVAARVADRCGLDASATRAAMEHDWRNLRMNEQTLAFARALGRSGRAAIVKENPEIFSEIIAPHYGLDRDFSVIVTSWEERLLDKDALCAIALDRLGAPGAYQTTLLADNRPENVRAFQACGGHGYLFTGDDTFADAFTSLRTRLLLAGRH